MTGLWLALLALALLAASSLASAVESAYLTQPRSEAESLTDGGRRRRLAAILADPLPHTQAVRFWRVFFDAAAGAAVALAYMSFLHSVWISGLWATLTMAVLGFLVVGVSPRRLGREHSTGLVIATAPLVRTGRVVLGPVPGWLERLITPRSARNQEATFFTEVQFRDMVDRANEANVIEDVEADLIQSVFELGDTRVRAVMVPRTDMVTADADAPVDDALQLSLRSGCSRLPVIGEDADDVRGIVYLKDLVRAVVVESRTGEQSVRLARPARFVPESKPVAELLQEMQRESVHVAIVVDEYGGTAGLVTLEDLLEEIVGEIDDEYDQERETVAPDGEGGFVVPAEMDIDEMGELFDEHLDDDEVDTVGGLLTKALGRVPVVGSRAVVGDLLLTATALSGRRNRLGSVHVRRAQAEEIAQAEGLGLVPLAPSSPSQRTQQQSQEPRA